MNEKLVRDKIPEIILSNGEEAHVRILSHEEYLVALDAKLREEVEEYLEANDLTELGDILEVIRAIAEARGSSYEETEELRIAKLKERGSFKKKLSLEIKD